jgi:hypothetical protein
VSVVYNCCWFFSPAQLFSGSSPAELMTTFFCLRFETSLIWRSMFPYLYPAGTWWPSYTPRHWVPFASTPTTSRAMVEVYYSACTRLRRTEHGRSSHIASERIHREYRLHHLFYCCVTSPRMRMLRALHSNGCTRHVS